MVVDDLQAVLACIREQLVYVERACQVLAASMRTGNLAAGLEATERICATLMVTDCLVESIGRLPQARGPGVEAIDIRDRMIQRAAPCLAVAVRDLRGASGLVRRFALSFGGAGHA